MTEAEFDILFEEWDDLMEEHEINLTYKQVAERWYFEGLKDAAENKQED